MDSGCGSADGVVSEASNVVVGKSRGLTTLELYIDPNNTTIPDYATAGSGAATLDTSASGGSW